MAGRFKPGKSGNPATAFKPGNRHRWQPGQSGNPAGIPKSRLQFEERFNAALLGMGTPEEAAALLWDPARKQEPWAVVLLLQRLAPETKQIKLTHGVQDEQAIDFEKLNDDQIAQLRAILEHAKVEPGTS